MPLELNGFTAWVECRGAELTPYNAERSEDGKSVTCWILSEVGKVSEWANYAIEKDGLILERHADIHNQIHKVA